MVIYILTIVFAALLQIGTIYFVKGDFLRNFLLVIPLIVVYQFLFLWSYTNFPKFIVIWFITAGVTSTLAFLVSHFLLKETITTWNIVGVILIIGGIALLQIKR